MWNLQGWCVVLGILLVVGSAGAQEEDLLEMSNAANRLYQQGAYREAIRIYEQAVEVARQKWGEEDRDTLGLMNNLAQTLKAQGDPASARELEEQVVEVRRRVLDAGSRDVELPSASLGGVANVRCDVGVWLDPRAFRAERRTGTLPAEDLELVRRRRRAFLEDRLQPSLLEADADEDPEYQRWREATLRPAAAELATPAPEGKLLRFPRTVRGWAVPLAAAASVVLAVGLATTVREIGRLEDALHDEHLRSEEIAASRSELEAQLDAVASAADQLDAALRELRAASDAALEELRTGLRRQLADRGARIAELSKAFLAEPHLLPLFELQRWERDRSRIGQPTVLPLGDDARLLGLAVEVEDPEPYLRYRLQIVAKGQDEVIWETDELVKKGRWLSLVVPSGFFEAGTQYQLRLAGLMGEEVVELEEKYLVMVRR